MSQSQHVAQRSKNAGEDLSAQQYRVMTQGSNVFTKCDTTDLPAGVLQNSPVSGSGASVRYLGTTKVEAAGAFSEGDELIVADSNGRVDTATASTANANVVGIALEAAGAAGDVVEMELRMYTKWFA